VYVPLAQNPQAVPAVVGLFTFEFTGIKFVNKDDLGDALDFVGEQVIADVTLTPDEITAITSVLGSLVYESQTTEFSPTVNGTQYTFTVTVTTDSGYIKVYYQR